MSELDKIKQIVKQSVDMIENWKGAAYIEPCELTDWQGDEIYQAVQSLKKLYQSKKDMALDHQYRLLHMIREQVGVNLVMCGNCGQVLLNEHGNDDIHCWSCEYTLSDHDCPDFDS